MNLPITLLLTKKDFFKKRKKKKKDNIGFLKFRVNMQSIVFCACVCVFFFKVNNKILLKTYKIIVNKTKLLINDGNQYKKKV